MPNISLGICPHCFSNCLRVELNQLARRSNVIGYLLKSFWWRASTVAYAYSWELNESIKLAAFDAHDVNSCSLTMPMLANTHNVCIGKYLRLENRRDLNMILCIRPTCVGKLLDETMWSVIGYLLEQLWMKCTKGCILDMPTQYWEELEVWNRANIWASQFCRP